MLVVVDVDSDGDGWKICDGWRCVSDRWWLFYLWF